MARPVSDVELIGLVLPVPVEMLVFDQIQGGFGCGRSGSVWSK